MISEKHHAVVWLDHHEARVIHLSGEATAVVHPEHAPRHLHARAGSAAGSHVTDAPEFFDHISKEVSSADRILVVGPAGAKGEFVKYLESHARDIAKRIAGVEAKEKLTDGQLLAEAHKFFLQSDKLQPSS